ncbi:MAG: phage baseplate assembly protein V, partial [Nitriliruptoraceae bacterium]
MLGGHLAQRDAAGQRTEGRGHRRGETREMEHVEPYGFTARPLKGAEAIAAALGGSRGNLVALTAFDRRHRRKGLAEGEVCLYTDEGDEIRFKRGRVIAITAGSAVEVTAPSVKAESDTAEVIASTSVKLDTPETEITGNVQIGGNLT